MAKLIPGRASCLHRMTYGEKRVSERLEQKLDDDYLLWFEVPIGPNYRKPDFIVFHPRRGILVLEVKDWKLEHILKADRKECSILTENGLKHTPNPLEQARQFAEEVQRLLERDPLLRHPEGSRYTGRLVCPWAHGVVLANISRRQLEEAGHASIFSPRLVICQDEFVPSVDAEAFQKRLWDMFAWQFTHSLTLPQIDRIRWHLFPEVRVVPGEGQFGLFDGGVKDPVQMPDLIKVMDIQQEQLARSLGDGHRIIHGVAGSGKTMILGYRCVQLAQAVNRPILVLCFNKTLSARLHQLIGERGLNEKVQVYNFHSWCYAQMQAYHLEIPTGKGMFEKFAPTVMDGVEKSLVPRGQYGAILIDEGHDFSPDWYRLITQMVDPNTNSLLVLYDDTQNIYGKADRRRFSWKSVGIDAVGHTTILKLNYRNTFEVLSVAKAFIDNHSAADGTGDDGQPVIAPESAGRRGPTPELVRAAGLSDEAKIIAARIRDETAKGRSLSDMAVVVRKDSDALFLHRALVSAGIEARIAHNSGKSTLFQGGPSVKVVSMHSSKGLEFPLVFIPRIGQMPTEGEDEQLEARLLYVAINISTKNWRTPGVSYAKRDFRELMNLSTAIGYVKTID